MSGTYAGNMGGTDWANHANSVDFAIRQRLAKCRTNVVVKVVAVHATSGSDNVPGTVDVQVAVNQVTADGTPIPHGVIYGLPYFRYKAGNSAIILDPAPNDIGVCVISDRDISSVKANSAISNPGSHRKFDLADGIYFGGILGTVRPTQFIAFTSTGINITTATLTLTGSLVVTGSAAVTGDVTAGEISLMDHVHGGVSSGTDDTDPPS